MADGRGQLILAMSAMRRTEHLFYISLLTFIETQGTSHGEHQQSNSFVVIRTF
jgi:hypothetical protein